MSDDAQAAPDDVVGAAKALVEEISTRGTHERWKRLDNALFALSSTDRAPAPSAWQPIETAPKDGTDILAVENGVVGEAYFNSEDDNWWWANTGPHDFDPSHAAYPTHWMPMPPGPLVSPTHSARWRGRLF